MSLLHLLQVLARPDGERTDRQLAGAGLGKRIDQLARGMVKPLPATAEELEDARQHLLLKASVGSSRFLGDSEGEAYGWCEAVLRNHVTSELRKTGRLVSLDDDRRQAPTPVAASPGPESYRTLQARWDALVKKVLATIPNHHRETDVPSVTANVRCYIEGRLFDLSAADQLERWGFTGRHAAEWRDDPAARKRALQRIFQIRTRGKREWNAVLGGLRTSNGLSADDLDALGELLPAEGG